MNTIELTNEQKSDIVLAILGIHYRVKLDDIFVKSRERHIVQKRQVAQYLLKKFTTFSLREIGEKTGNRGHATILHACKTVENLKVTNNSIKLDVDVLEKKILSNLKSRSFFTDNLSDKKINLFILIQSAKTDQELKEVVLDFFNIDKNISTLQISVDHLLEANLELSKKLEKYNNEILSKILALPEEDYQTFLKYKAEPHLKMLKVI